MVVRIQRYPIVLLIFLYINRKDSVASGGFILLAKGHLLKESLIKETKAEDAIRCVQHCLIEGPHCKSINYGIASHAKGICQLNGDTATGQSKAILIADKNFDYFERDSDNSPICISPTKKLNAARVKQSCADWYKNGEKRDGVYTIDPDGEGDFQVRCDMTTNRGGWTIFQRRIDGSQDFYLQWADYKTGFGDLNGEFWLGLDKIHRLSKAGQDVLRVDLADFLGETRYAEYGKFAVASGADKYKLTVGSYSGNANDSLAEHNGKMFSTKDFDNDRTNDQNCAVAYNGAWWYSLCHASNLNGRYLRGIHTSYANGVIWSGWTGHYYSLKKSEMKIRPHQF